jgi:hypothetical protein
LVRGDALLVLDLGLDVVDGVGGLDLKGDGLAREGLDETVIEKIASVNLFVSSLLSCSKGSFFFRRVASSLKTAIVVKGGYLHLHCKVQKRKSLAFTIK